jgi:sRNA-binding protein
MTLETRNFTPAEAAARHWQSKAEIVALLKDVRMPYSLMIHKQIKQVFPDIPSQHLRRAMHWITSSKRYLQATVAAVCRHSLDGTTSKLSDEHRQYAVEMLKPRMKPSKSAQAEKRVIASSETPPVAQQAPVKPDVVISTKRRRTLCLKKGAA